MNRPYGAVDVAANLKGAVPKATTQKILVALAEKGELVQKVYGGPSRPTGYIYAFTKALLQEKQRSLFSIRQISKLCRRIKPLPSRKKSKPSMTRTN
jgi:hypothetical protein